MQLNCRRRSAMQLTQALVDMSYKQAGFFSIILLTFLLILHSKIPSPDKLVKTRHIWRVIYDVMTYKLSQLGHDVQNWSVTVVHAVNVSTTRHPSSWVELCRYKRALKQQQLSYLDLQASLVVVVYAAVVWCTVRTWLPDDSDSCCGMMMLQGVWCGRTTKAEVAADRQGRSCSAWTTTQSTILWYTREFDCQFFIYNSGNALVSIVLLLYAIDVINVPIKIPIEKQRLKKNALLRNFSKHL